MKLVKYLLIKKQINGKLNEETKSETFYTLTLKI